MCHSQKKKWAQSEMYLRLLRFCAEAQHTTSDKLSKPKWQMRVEHWNDQLQHLATILGRDADEDLDYGFETVADQLNNSGLLGSNSLSKVRGGVLPWMRVRPRRESGARHGRDWTTHP